MAEEDVVHSDRRLMQYSELACTTYVLDLYEEPYDPKRPLVNLDEKPKQLLGEKRMSIPMKPESPEKYDYEYVRNGTANIFVAVEFKAGKRVTQVTKRRTMKDFARFVKMLVDGYPDVEAIRLVTDNLNTHRERRSTGSLRGRRLIRSYISITFRN